MFNVMWTSPHPWVYVLGAVIFGSVVALYNLRMLESARKFWGDTIMLDRFSPKTHRQSFSLWSQWVAVLALLALALAGPNLSQSPLLVKSGAVQVEFVYDVSPSEGAQDTRSFYGKMTGERDPGPEYEWGTRLDVAKYYTKTDLLPQLKKNEAGLVTVEGVGYNMWDITPDLGVSGAFYHMLDQFTQVGSAPGGGADYASGLQTALDEFALVSKLEADAGDKVEKVKFVVLFSDGGFTGDQTSLNKVLDEFKEKNVRLLVVGIGGNLPVAVAKYDPDTHKRTTESYDGVTKIDTSVLTQITDRVPGAQLILAPPGTAHIQYNFPEKAGGLYAVATASNLKPWLLISAIIIFLSITLGGGGLVRPKVVFAHISDLRNLRNWRNLSGMSAALNRAGLKKKRSAS